MNRAAFGNGSRLRIPGSLVVLAFGVLMGTPAVASQGTGIVVSVPFLADLVSQLSCEGPLPEKTEVLLPAGTDPHTFSLRPSDRKKVAEARMVLSIHPQFETWLVPLAPRGADARWISATQGLELRKGDHGGGHHHHGKSAHGNAEVDPHIWHSPDLTLQAARKVGETLARAFPAQQEPIRRCLKSFEERAATRAKSLRDKVRALPAANRVIATSHDSFGYLGSSFDIEVINILGLSTEAAPTPGQLRKAVERVKAKGAKALFLDSATASRHVESVARETGVKVGGTLYADGLGAKGSGAENVLDLWTHNIETILAALPAAK